MMENTQAKFEGWAVVELFGHQRETGFVSTEYFGQAAMFRIDVPELPEREYELERPEYIGVQLAPKGTKVRRDAVPGRTRLVNPSALYALNPCSEEAARKAVESLVRRELSIISLPEGKQLTAAESQDFADPEDQYEDEEEEEDAEIPI
jgi:hypothetical protein